MDDQQNPTTSPGHQPLNPGTTAEQYQRLMQQAQVLLEQAAKLREMERQEVLADVRTKVRMYNITSEEIDGAPRALRGRKISKQAVLGRYRGPNGETWSGVNIGRKPDWVRKIIAEGGNLEDYLVK